MASAIRNDATFMFDRAAETMARGDLAALQLQRLKQAIERAYAKVPNVRKKFDAAGVRPDQGAIDLVRRPMARRAPICSATSSAGSAHLCHPWHAASRERSMPEPKPHWAPEVRSR